MLDFFLLILSIYLFASLFDEQPLP